MPKHKKQWKGIEKKIQMIDDTLWLLQSDSTGVFLQLLPGTQKEWQLEMQLNPVQLFLSEHLSSVSRPTDLLLYAAEELEHGDVGWRLGHAQGHADALQLQEHGAARLLAFLFRLINEDHPRRLQLRHQEGCGEKWMGSNVFTAYLGFRKSYLETVSMLCEID